MSRDLITNVNIVFDPHEALHPGDPRFVEFSAVRGSAGLLKRLANTIRRASGPTYQLLSGHRGCGKTTDLFRLQQDFFTTEPRYFVVYCKTDLYIDPNDVDYPDVLLALVQQLWKDAKEKGIRLDPGRVQALVDGIKGILPAGVIKGPAFELRLAELGKEVRGNPDNRHLVRQHLRDRTPTLVEAVNEVVAQAEQAFRAQGYAGLVIIMDNLDRVFRNPIPHGRRTSHEVLFIDGGEQLRQVGCHVVYTVPIALLHSPEGPLLDGIYGCQRQVLPMIPVSKRPAATGKRPPEKKGLAKLFEMVEKRLHHAGTTTADAFDSKQTIRRLCTVSGGYFRNLMIFAQAAMSYVDNLPITAAAVEQAVRETRDGYILSLFPQQWQYLRQVAEGKAVAPTEDFLQLLTNWAVLEYRDEDGPWYDVNPAAREAREFKGP
jgi:hypothetical protein